MKPRILMCAPTRFEIRYVINPWMRGHLDAGERPVAITQWNRLYAALARHADVELIEPAPGWPDMVFTANAGVLLGKRVLLARFRHRQRQGEEPYFAQWFARQGFAVLRLPEDLAFEGAGDALLDRAAPLLWMGHGFRTGARATTLVAAALDIEVVPLRLTDPRFYHLDTCLCPLAGGELLYHPGAFDAESLRRIEARVPAHARLVVDEADARSFACNAVNLAGHIFLNRASRRLVTALNARGYRVTQTPLDEFMKAGGAAKCLTLRLDESLPVRTAAVA